MGKQSRNQDTSGGNIVGKAPTKHRIHKPGNIAGKSGTPDNQSTNRGKGRT